MKKTLLTLLAFSSSFALISQSSNQMLKANYDKAIPAPQKADGSEMIAGPVAPGSVLRIMSETKIGETVYDLQTNGTSQQRIFNHADGTISATWTMDNGSSPYTSRGAGYNYYNGTSWGSFPTSKIESTRNGWPALASGMVNNNEFVISHSGSGGLTLNSRSTKGTGVWKETIIPTNVPSTNSVLWPRAVVGGSKDSTLHVIAAVRANTTGGPEYKGLVTALVYYRSKDLGVSWDIKDSIIPGLDSSFFTYVSADSYSMDARGNTVAFSVYNSWGDVLVFKSTNNGDTWTKTIVNDFPINKYKIDDGSDIDGDGVFDTISSCDGSGSMLLDNTNKVHVFFGRMRVLDSDTTDGNTSYFPGTNGLMYWNESFGADSTQLIAFSQDLDASGTLDVFPTGGSFPIYGTGISSMPTCGVDANNTVYLAYSALAESHTDGVQCYRHIYIMNSTDGGTTWSNPEDYTPDFDFATYEAVYASMAKRVDTSLHILYQRDFNPGQSISGDLDPAAINEMIYLGVDTALDEIIAGINEIKNNLVVNLFPNPATDNLNVKINTLTAVNETINISLVDALGRNVISFNEKLNGTNATLKMDISSLKNGIYFVRIANGKSIISKTFVKR